MKFAAAPANDFLAFMEEYTARCAARCPKIVAVAAKWAFEDLIPGLSDFDTRFIVRGPMSVAEWTAMSLAVGEVHTQMCRAFPAWARNLEHLPGVNLTLAEATDPAYFSPEFQQWTFYRGDADALAEVRAAVAAVPWSERDEAFHLKKFAAFCGPYQRGIDPAINLGPWESKYPLHSRFMHYFTPPVHAAVCLALRRNVRGKLEALRLAAELFPRRATLGKVFEALAHHYEVPAWYAEPALSELETELEAYLDGVWASLGDALTLARPAPGDRAAAVRAKVAALPTDPLQTFLESAKFCRLMRGRLLFYAERIAWFASEWLIANELGRIVGNFYEKPLAAYTAARWGERLPADEALRRVRGGVLPDATADGVEAFVRLARQPAPSGREREHARAVAGAYDPVLAMIETLKGDLVASTRSTVAPPPPREFP